MDPIARCDSLVPITKSICDSLIGLLQSTTLHWTRLEQSRRPVDATYLLHLVQSDTIDIANIEQTISEYKEAVVREQANYFNDPEQIDSDYNTFLAEEAYFDHAEQIIAEYKGVLTQYTGGGNHIMTPSENTK